jgi:hypothetical protein
MAQQKLLTHQMASEQALEIARGMPQTMEKSPNLFVQGPQPSFLRKVLPFASQMQECVE